MGLIKAALTATGSTLADQWKEFFYCEAMPSDLLVTKGRKRTGKGSSNHGNDNIISDGSGIAVADGQCMIIVEKGRILDICAEPGEYKFSSSTEPSIFTGSLGAGIKNTFKKIGERISFGGDTGNDQRVYYFNTKEIIDNKFGTPAPIPFRVVDRNIGLDIDVSVRCNGVYSYRISDPLLFYANVCGNVTQDYRRAQLDTQLKAEFISALQPAFFKISELQVRPNALPGHVLELCDAMNTALCNKWKDLRGIEIVSIALNSVTLPEEDAEMIKQAQRTAINRDPSMAAATLTGATADAMKAAASNSNGAMAGFYGMNMAQQAGGMNAQNLFAMAQQQQAQQAAMAQQAQPAANTWRCECGTENTGKFCMNCAKPKPAPAGTWKCECGTENTGKFCMNCAKPRPTDSEGWTCSCGAVNKGKFCTECAKPRPAGAPLYRCDKCGWTPADPKNPPKFCPECGDVFDANDITG